MNPSQFKNPENASITSSFYCAFCGAGNAVKLRFLSDKTIEFIEEINFKSLIKDDPLPFYIGGHSGDEVKSPEILSETDALSLLNDIDN
jgi:hypothetical protein